MIVRNTCGLTPNEIESVSIVNIRQQIWEEPRFSRDERNKIEVNDGHEDSNAPDLTEHSIHNTLSPDETT